MVLVKKCNKYLINVTFKAIVSELASAFPKWARTLIHKNQINGGSRLIQNTDLAKVGSVPTNFRCSTHVS
jgi:hypothetical protein